MFFEKIVILKSIFQDCAMTKTILKKLQKNGNGFKFASRWFLTFMKVD